MDLDDSIFGDFRFVYIDFGYMSNKKTRNILTIKKQVYLSRTQQQEGTEMNQQLNQLIVNFDFAEKKTALNFEAALSESIDEVFTSFGEDVKQAVYGYLQCNVGVGKEQIPGYIEEFVGAVELFFGDAALLVELKIIESLRCKVKSFAYKPKSKDLFFVDYLAALQKH